MDMDAHQNLMQALYAALGRGGAGLSRTQIMRLAWPELSQLRQDRVSWGWIAARIERVQSFGVETPLPSAEEVDAGAVGQGFGPVRAAFVRIQRETALAPAHMPAARAGPPTRVPSRPASAPVRSPDKDVPRAPTQVGTFLDSLQKLKRPAT
jgi:hypothetical protein